MMSQIGASASSRQRAVSARPCNASDGSSSGVAVGVRPPDAAHDHRVPDRARATSSTGWMADDDWQDFSNASPWEEFVGALESTLRGWGLDGSATPALPMQHKLRETPDRVTGGPTAHHIITFGGGRYKVSLYTSPPPPADLWRRLGCEHLPRALVDAISGGDTDYPQHAHRLQRWYGIREFIVLAPVGSASTLYARCVQVLPWCGRAALTGVFAATLQQLVRRCFCRPCALLWAI